MSISEVTHSITSFASLILNAGRIRQIQDETEKQYLGCAVIETQPNGSKHEAVIEHIEWCPSCGLNGEWLVYIRYANSTIPGAWVTKSVLTLVD